MSRIDSESLRKVFARRLTMEFSRFSMDLPSRHLEARRNLRREISSEPGIFVPASGLPAFTGEVPDTAGVLSVLAGMDCDTEDSARWLLFFQQRFEVSKALFTAYPARPVNMARPANRPNPEKRSILREARPYACLALALLRRYRETGRHAYLSTALKAADLIAASPELEGRDCPESAALLDEEISIIASLPARLSTRTEIQTPKPQPPSESKSGPGSASGSREAASPGCSSPEKRREDFPDGAVFPAVLPEPAMPAEPPQPLSGFALCCLDSPRTRAYLAALRSRGLAPAEALLLPGASVPDGLSDESRRHGYAQQWFDPDVPAETLLRTAGCRCLRAESRDINHPSVRDALARLESPVILFTGGGIAAKETLDAPRGRFVHIHPGAVPDYRGSTCFYFSLLDEGLLGASAFYMAERIDTGPVIAVRRFVANAAPDDGRPLFMDHILDPCLRAAVLAELTGSLLHGPPPSRPQEAGTGETCYVAHPVIRALATARLASMHDPAVPEGLYPLPAAPGQP